ncbi:MAG: nucleotidyl transferase AbiEii/AbiGii toxin family protein [Lachnospiraceae bacterium]|nr:nucleotidyl transferase AbiEii/AbiGii toxin family protein [Lachnospiraceae bacterium]
MPQYNKTELGRVASEAGFVRDTFEKVLRLKAILRFINEDEFLCEHLLLKGGTAINLSVFNLPRLSVDIDMDYMPNDTREDMMECRTRITEAIKVYMGAEGYQLSEGSRFSHSLDAFYFNYQNVGGNKDMIKIELNYSLRAHIFEPVYRSILPLVFDDGMKIHMVEPMEIFAAKGNALITRAAARDLYDWGNMIAEKMFDNQSDLFRKCFIFYMTISSDTVNKSFDTAAIDTLSFDKIKRDLFPVLNKKDNFLLDERKRLAKEYIANLMVLTNEEKQYIDKFEQKEFAPELLFEDKGILKRIENHPMAIWKCKKEVGYNI